MANFTYTETDIAPAVGNFVAGVLVGLGSFGGLIALIVVWRIITGKGIMPK